MDKLRELGVNEVKAAGPQMGSTDLGNVNEAAMRPVNLATCIDGFSSLRFVKMDSGNAYGFLKTSERNGGHGYDQNL